MGVSGGSPLPVSPFHVRLIAGMLVPLRARPANLKRVTQEGDNHAKRQHKNCINQGKENTRLEIADFSADTLPTFPKTS